jgi:hypothetical protein
MSTLQRVNFEDKSSFTDSRVQLALDAKDSLGYAKLANAIAIPGALLSTLKKLDIQPFIESKVLRYQDSKEGQTMFTGTKNTLLICILAVICSSLFVYGMAYAEHFPWSALHYAANTLTGLATLVSIIAAIAHGSSQEGWGHGSRTIRRWMATPLEQYSGTVPEFALSKAVEIKKALPEASFQVEQLVLETERRSRPVPDPDPFLVAVLGKERYHIDVWEEKEYEKTL